MADWLERYDRHLVCDDYRDDPSAGYGRLSAISVKGHWRGARIRSDRRIDLLARSFEGKIGAVSEMPGCASMHSRCLSPSKFSFRDKYSPPISANSPLFEIAGVLVRFNYVVSIIV